MDVLPALRGSHIAMRRGVRHREILTLVIAILGSIFLLFVAIDEVLLAADEGRDPDVYALALLFAPLIVWFARGQLWAQQRLRGIKLTPEQFPEAHAMVVDAAARAGMSYVPDAYVVLGNGMINAAASGHGFRRYIFVYSDLFEIGARRATPTPCASSSGTRWDTSPPATRATGGSSASVGRSGSRSSGRR